MITIIVINIHFLSSIFVYYPRPKLGGRDRDDVREQ